MPRYIDADALKSYLNEREYADMYYIEALFGIIDRQPTISPDEARGVGEWEQKEIINLDDIDIEQLQSARCSVCNKHLSTPYLYYFDNFKYCPSCGAKMGVE